MGSISNYLEDEILDHVLKVGSWSQPTNIYVALSTADPTDDASGLAEPSGDGYARVQHNSWNAASSRSATNDGQVTFGEASGSWGTITHWALFDAITDGNMLVHGSFSASKTVGAGDNVYIADTAMSVTVSSGGMANYLANKVLDHILKTASYTVPTHIKVYLSTADPGDDDAGRAEPDGNGYAQVTCNGWDAASGGATANTAEIDMGTATDSWGTITHFGLVDESDNPLIYAALDASKAVGTDDNPKFAAGELDITLD
jgi:hypothetical protein